MWPSIEFYSNKESTEKNTLHKFAEGSLEEEDGTPVDNLHRIELVIC